MLRIKDVLKRGGYGPLPPLWEDLKKGELAVLKIKNPGDIVETKINGEQGWVALQEEEWRGRILKYVCLLRSSSSDIHRFKIIESYGLKLLKNELGEAHVHDEDGGYVRLLLRPYLPLPDSDFWNRIDLPDDGEKRTKVIEILKHIEDNKFRDELDGLERKPAE